MVDLLNKADTEKQRARAVQGVIEADSELARLNKQLNKRQKLMDKTDQKKK